VTFKELLDHPEILKAIEDAGYQSPTTIQCKVIPAILKGSDLRASAETGTGKTAAFLLPALYRLATPSPLPGKGPRILILVPTRELAIQVADEAIKYAKYLHRIKTVCIYGGVPYPVQNRQLARPYEILVATPGRLIDHFNRGKIDFSRLEMFVIDEADRMLDMGFIEPVKEISAHLPKRRQTLLFSATLKGNVLKLSEHLLNQPIEITTDDDPLKHENIQQSLHYVDGLDHKYRLLDSLLAEKNFDQLIVFIATKHHADTLVDKLLQKGHEAAALHGNMNQRQRTRTIKKLREGSIRILIATDVAGRGIDIPSISHVINFDLPKNVEDYVHRIGRTGRAGTSGRALSFATHKDKKFVKQIENYTGQRISISIPAGKREEESQKNKKDSSGEKIVFSSNSRKPQTRPHFRKKFSHAKKSRRKRPF
jgi:superfamily II DNA/RNA helicase